MLFGEAGVGVDAQVAHGPRHVVYPYLAQNLLLSGRAPFLARRIAPVHNADRSGGSGRFGEEERMAVKEGWRGRFFEDFEVGDIYEHPLIRTVTTTDNV